MANQPVKINPGRGLFYCWGWDKWWAVRKLKHCFNQGCRFMYIPALAHYRKLGRCAGEPAGRRS